MFMNHDIFLYDIILHTSTFSDDWNALMKRDIAGCKTTLMDQLNKIIQWFKIKLLKRISFLIILLENKK